MGFLNIIFYFIVHFLLMVLIVGILLTVSLKRNKIRGFVAMQQKR